MKRRLVPAVAALILLGPLAAPAARAADEPISAEEAAFDKAFTDAVKEARASLPVFWMRLAETPANDPDIFQLKVAFRAPKGGGEEIWLSDVKRDGSRITGRLNYDPESIPGLHRGQIVPIPEASIIDWTVKEGRKRYGHYTTRVLAKVHPEESAKAMAQLSDNPLPADARK